jgi:hypothetical protein
MYQTNQALDFLRNLEQYQIYLTQFQSVPPSDFLVSTIHYWNQANSVKYLSFDDCLLLLFTKPITGKSYAHLLCKTPNDKNILRTQEIISLYNITKLKISFCSNLEKVAANELNLIEDADEFEYIYDLKDWDKLEGSKFKKQRNSIAKANKSYPILSVSITDLNSEISNQAELLNFCEDCLQIKTNKDASLLENLQNEWMAFNNCLKLKEQLNLKILKVYAEQKLSGILIYEIVNKDWIQGHFFKSYSGLGMFVLNQFAKELVSQSFTFFNFQEDKGVENLKYFKQQLNPVSFIKTYKLANHS